MVTVEEKMKRLKSLRRQVQECTDCTNDSEKQLYNIVAEDSKRSPKGLNYWCDWGVPSPNYNAKLMIIGQDWGPVEYLDKFIALNGGALPSPYKEDNNKTWNNLMRFLKQADIAPKNIFLTNAILCLRKKGMSGNCNISDKWFENCYHYLNEQIDIISPKVIVVLGQKVFNLLLKQNNINNEYENYGELVRNYEPEKYKMNGIYLVPIYHTGGLGQSNRKRAKIKGDPADDFRTLKKNLIK